MYFTGFRCLGCGAHYAPDRDVLLCPACHNLLEALYDYDGIRAHVDRNEIAASRNGVWRWASLLPVQDHNAIVTLGEGDTPMLRCERLAKSVGVRELWLMSDAANPTGSLKDRSVTVAATKAVRSKASSEAKLNADLKISSEAKPTNWPIVTYSWRLISSSATRSTVPKRLVRTGMP